MDGRRVLVRIAVLAACARLALEFVGLMSVAMHGRGIAGSWLALWRQWDAHGYLRIAEIGYPRVPVLDEDAFNLGFFPGYPFAVRMVATIVRHRLLSGLLVSYVATVFAYWFLYMLVRLERDDDHAWRAVVLLTAFPTAYFLSAPYSEALFVCAVTGAIYLARTGRWRRSALAGALATATRLVGLAVVPALAVEALRRRDGGREPRLRRLLAAASAAAGFVAFLAVSRWVAHDAFRYFALQRTHWFQTTVPPWEPVWTGVSSLATGTSSNLAFVFGTRLAALALAVPLLVLAVRRLPTPDWVYGWAGFLPLLFTGWLTALPRFLLGVYPLFMVGADLTRSRRVVLCVVVVSAALQSWWFWRYASGEWTF